MFNKVFNISDLINKYDMFFFDIWGVIVYVVQGEHKTASHVIDVVNKLIKLDKIFFVSNASDTHTNVANILKEVGVQIKDVDRVITAGRVMRDSIRSENTKFSVKTFVLEQIKNEGIDWINEEKSIEIVNSIDLAELLVINFHSFLDNTEEIQLITDILETAVRKNIPAICPNPDKHFKIANKVYYCAGFFAVQYEMLGGKVRYFGKPYSNIFDYAFNKSGVVPEKNKILMVGDTLATDIKGAQQMKIDGGLVLTGNTAIKNFNDVVCYTEHQIFNELLLQCQMQNIFPSFLVSVR